jgi:hypothetical protein
MAKVLRKAERRIEASRPAQTKTRRGEAGGSCEFRSKGIAILGTLSRHQQRTAIKLTLGYRLSLLACAANRCRLRFLIDRRRRFMT